jgi:hypothetical protein
LIEINPNFFLWILNRYVNGSHWLIQREHCGTLISLGLWSWRKMKMQHNNITREKRTWKMNTTFLLWNWIEWMNEWTPVRWHRLRSLTEALPALFFST